MKMTMTIAVENIKCGGCANTIKLKLSSIEGVLNSEVDIEQGLIKCELAANVSADEVKELVKQKLCSLGYPEKGSVEGLQSIGAKAKSFVSCATGKMSDSSSD